MKKRLLMLAGAGASSDCGMPSVAVLDDLMRGWARLTAQDLGCQDYYAAIWAALERHLAHGFESNREAPNFEKALSDLAALCQWVRPPPEGGALRGLTAAAPPPGLVFPNADLYGPYITLKVFATRLMSALATHVREKSRALDTSSPGLEAWRVFLGALRAKFEVVIYTLNYDTVASTCWPEALTGFDIDGHFDPRAVHERAWEGLFHLHGSVEFTLHGGASGEIRRQELGRTFLDCDDRVADYRTDGRDFAPTTLIAGGFKLDQVLADPFHTYHSAFVRDVTRAEVFIIAGYGFGDAHINRALKNRFAGRGARPPVLVIDRAGAQRGTLDFRQDRWAINLKQTLAAHAGYEQRHGCEVSSHGAAMWPGGFRAACGEMERLSRWLDAEAIAISE